MILNTQEFADLLGVKAGTLKAWRSNGDKRVPQPTSYTNNPGKQRPSPAWTLEAAERFKAKLKPKPAKINRAKVKEMVSQGFTAGEIAEKFSASTGYISGLCRKMGVKPRGIKPLNMSVQVEMYPVEITNTFHLFIHAHRAATPSLRVTV